MLDTFLYAILPYLALGLFLFGSLYRYVYRGFSYSSLSSQFLENRHHFWGIVPFHLGILFVLLGHFVAFLVPRAILVWNEQPLRLYILEVAALIGAILALVGLLNLIWRRATNSRIRRVSTKIDWVVLGLLLLQITTGILVAVSARWGSSWFASNLSPYLWSVVTFQPEIAYVTGMTAVQNKFGAHMVQLHIIGAWLLFAIFPFSRLVHILVIPNPYLWRRPQVVIWNRDRQAAAAPVRKSN